MSGAETEGRLFNWRYGQTQAERLTAALLHLEGFEDVDPQHPLGGPDGIKDVLCRRAGRKWVAAAYFPTTQSSFPDVKRKFLTDLGGVTANSADGIAFFTNQRLSVGERESLITAARPAPAELYHLERIVGLLNAPKGCGIRLEYLRIPMTEEEQWAFWSTMNADVVRRLAENEARRDHQLKSLDQKIDRLLVRTSAIIADLRAGPSSISVVSNIDELEMPTASLSQSGLAWLHRLLTDDLGTPEAVRGRFRSVQVWIGGVGSSPEDANHVPPSPEQIPELISELLDWWHREHPRLRGKEKDEVCRGLAELHHRILFIHPFLDANGRVARAVLDQAARELLNQSVGHEITEDPSAYYAALAAADRNDYVPLTRRIAASLT